MKNIILVICAMAPAMLLVGCMEAHPAATSDDVLAQQYRARGLRGALTGPEATTIADTYRHQTGAAPAGPAAGR